MSGYLAGLLAVLAINIIVAYSVFVPAAAGLLNLGAAGFVLVGAYAAGAMTALFGVPLWLALVLGGLMAGTVAFLISFPILRTRGIYMVLATFAFAEVVAGVLLNIPALGGAAGLSVMAYAGLPLVVPVALCVIAFVAWLMSTRFGLSVRAMRRAGISGDASKLKAERTAIRDTLQSTNIDGVIGKICFSRDRDSELPAFIIRIKNGQRTLLDSHAPDRCA